MRRTKGLTTLTMEIPKRRRQNTIGVRYIKGSIIDEHYEEIIENKLGLKDEDIKKIEELNPTTFIFKLDEHEYNRICDEYAYKFIHIDEFTVILIEDISSYVTKVKVNGNSLDIEESEIMRILSEYGYIKRHYYKGKYNVKYFQKRETGMLILHMELDKPIPSSFFIKDTRTFLYVKYTGQPLTCHNCGELNHKVKDCLTRPGNGINVIDLDPENTAETENDDDNDSDDQQSTTSEVNINSKSNNNENSDSDTTETTCSRPSASQQQPTSPNAQLNTGDKTSEPVSNNKSANKPNLNATHCVTATVELHMPNHTNEKPSSGAQCTSKKTHLDESLMDQTGTVINHTGENATPNPNGDTKNNNIGEKKNYTCKTCNLNFTTDENLSQHTEAHEGLIPFKCSECSYKCDTIKGLTKHMTDKSHTQSLTQNNQGNKTSPTFADKVKNPSGTTSNSNTQPRSSSRKKNATR